ncbi:MAG: hypothetical protein A3F54_01355 [Candidatus Kerfeldbacteria bacterium RIFCSPHIGHO2_12_FULL_48_17]|uniref:Rod shape-determining protein MreD n=1 Tax=Candidatus Kerfeldbacteria bacterium RIFCSPHIGHO2_12_FULL_48_17 TaxID=1798542 RepID=A0A1G2B0F7_9BACT|nr:MAG: hypothetical protein A3F54_01355 [Candidatus Kerfeldbacteria bacterium RIFCSPHIGHO2_12_FULL_48_17]
MRSFFSRFLLFLSLLFIILLQVSFFSIFSGGTEKFFFVIVFLLFIMFVSSFQVALAWALVAGVLLDFFSPLNVGTFTLPLVLALVFCFVIFRSLVTIQTLFSVLILLIITTLAFYAIVLVVSWLFWVFRWNVFFIGFSDISLYNILVQLALNSILATVGFYGFRGLKSRFIWARHF